MLSRINDIQKAPIQQLLSEVEIPRDTISLGQGIPFFGPPREAIDAACSTLHNLYSYTSDAGSFELLEAISRKLRRENGLTVDPNRNIIVTSGANQAFINSLLAITKPRDDIILFSPVYFNHVMAVKLAACNPIIIPAGEDYLPSIDILQDSITSKTKAIITVSPNNPTGAVYPKTILREINQICRDRGIYHISDEVYEYYIYDDAQHISPAIFDDTLEYTITIFSFSKSFGMSGYRIGYIVTPFSVYDEILKVQDTTTICASISSQVAAIKAIDIGRGYLESFYPILKKIRNLFIEKLRLEDKIIFHITKGGYFFLLKLRTDLSDWEVSKRLIEGYRVIALPGSIFYTSYPSLRVSYGNVNIEKAEEGLTRLTKGLRDIL